jgi:hypothetical protein
MNYFFVQRLSAGFLLSLVASIFGFLAFSLEYSPRTAAIFVGYLIVLCAYLNLLGRYCSISQKTSTNALT